MNLHILLTGLKQVEDVRLQCLPEQDVGELSIGSAVCCCMAGDIL